MQRDTPSPAHPAYTPFHPQAWQLKRAQKARRISTAKFEKPEVEHLPAITESDEPQGSKALDTPTLLASPFADSPADVPAVAVPSGDAAAAAEAGNGATAARVLSGKAMSGGVGALASQGSLAIAPLASGLGSQRLMSVRLTAGAGGLVYNSAPIPTVLPSGGELGHARWCLGCREAQAATGSIARVRWAVALLDAGGPVPEQRLIAWPCCRLEAHGPAGAPRARAAPDRQRAAEEARQLGWSSIARCTDYTSAQ